MIRKLRRTLRPRHQHLVTLLADYERRNARIQFLAGGRYMVGHIMAGNDEMCMFRADPWPGSPIQKDKIVHIALAQVTTVEEVNW